MCMQIPLQLIVMVTNYNSTSICMHNLYVVWHVLVERSYSSKSSLECAEVNAESNTVKLSTSRVKKALMIRVCIPLLQNITGATRWYI